VLTDGVCEDTLELDKVWDVEVAYPTTQVGADCTNQCYLFLAPGTNDVVAKCDESVEFTAFGCGDRWLMLEYVQIHMAITNPGPTKILVEITYSFKEWRNIIDGSGSCAVGTGSATWTVTDVYELDGDCSDATEIPFVERVLGGDGISDATTITWGNANSQTYTLCDPATVTTVA
jgi:hypothetical protein